jgi:hypothetical protein
VTKGERKVDGQRNQREPRAMPNMFPKPAHLADIIPHDDLI